MTTYLRQICHSRAGDKGNISNLSLVPYDPADYERVKEAVTAARVGEFFAGIADGPVTRYELPNMPALNFVIERALDGGNTRSLRVDGFGKSLSSYLLSMPLPE